MIVQVFQGDDVVLIGIFQINGVELGLHFGQDIPVLRKGRFIRLGRARLVVACLHFFNGLIQSFGGNAHFHLSFYAQQHPNSG